MGFYEPLHESLASLSLLGVADIRPEIWDSWHPDPERPYFEEFTPLLSATPRGVAGYRLEFSVDSYFAGRKSGLPELAAYIRSLLDIAHAGGKVAVLKFARSMGRVGWMRCAFPHASHVVVLRNPWSQWLSGWNLFVRHETPYFVAMPFAILTRHRTHPAVAGAAAALKIRLPDLDSNLERRYQICVEAVKSAPPEALYRAFLTLWTVTTFDALNHAQLIIDSDRLALSNAYRIGIERRVAGLTGIKLDLSGARLTNRTQALDESLIRDCDIDLCYEHAFDACTSLEQDTDADLNASAAATLRTKICDASMLFSMSRRTRASCRQPH